MSRASNGQVDHSNEGHRSRSNTGSTGSTRSHTDHPNDVSSASNSDISERLSTQQSVSSNDFEDFNTDDFVVRGLTFQNRAADSQSLSSRRTLETLNTLLYHSTEETQGTSLNVNLPHSPKQQTHHLKSNFFSRSIGSYQM